MLVARSLRSVVAAGYGTHKSPTIRRWLQQHPRFHVHYTPTYSSWIIQVEPSSS